MGTTRIENRKLSVIEFMAKLDNEALLLQIENLINPPNDFWEELPEEDKEKILKGMKQHDEGKRMEFGEFMKKLKEERRK